MTYRKLWFSLALVLGARSAPVWAQAPQQTTDQQKIQELEQKIEELDQRVRVDERKKEIQDEDAATAARSGATVSAGPGGFITRSNDGNFLLRISGDLQIDNRTFPGESAVTLTDQILIRRLRPVIQGTVFRYIDFYLRPDFGQGTTSVNDAYIDFKYFPRAILRVGKFKPPVGLERLQSDDDTTFPERGLPTLLAPSRDVGYQLSGDLVPRRASYAVGVFNGVADNSTGTDVSVSGHRDYAGRIFLTPFLLNANHPLSGLGIGVAASSGGVDNLALPTFRTFGQVAFFPFASGVTSGGHRTRLALQAYYYLGPFGLIAEYTLDELGLQKGTVRRDVAFRAWQVAASYVLTGEKKAFTALTPRKNFDPHNHGWGAVELAVRVGDFNAEQGIYDYGFAVPTTTPRHAHEWVGGVNWYLNRIVKISLDYGNTNFGGGGAASLGGNRPSERVVINRFQINF